MIEIDSNSSIEPFPAATVSTVKLAGVLATAPNGVIPGPYADILIACNK